MRARIRTACGCERVIEIEYVPMPMHIIVPISEQPLLARAAAISEHPLRGERRFVLFEITDDEALYVEQWPPSGDMSERLESDWWSRFASAWGRIGREYAMGTRFADPTSELERRRYR